MTHEIISFGKHKGKPVEILAQDKEYSEWLVAQPWFKQKYQNIYTVVINNFRQPVDTPEHNAMQLKFLDQNYALKLAYYLEPKLFNLSSTDINNRLKTAIKSKPMYLNEIKSQLPDSDKTKLLRISVPTFEEGYDVAYSVQYAIRFSVMHRSTYNGDSTEVFSCYQGDYINLKIEIKPTIGDDFPSVLRQMKASMPIRFGYEDNRNKRCLLVGSYTGEGATKEQFIQFFQSQNFNVIFPSDITNVVLPKYEEEFQFDSSVLPT